jgi:4-diphosphocytidyl-2-C-methyl-D-erythritol kinase
VPFFLDPRLARVGGIGERITTLPEPPEWHLIIAVPPITVPTGLIFGDLTPDNWSGPAKADQVAALMAGNLSPSLFVNDLEVPAMQHFPLIAELKRHIEDIGARVAAMSGSGGAVFGIFTSDGEADRAAVELRQRSPETRVFRVRPYYHQSGIPAEAGVVDK